MFSCGSILSVFNPKIDKQLALERAAFLAKATGAKLHLVGCVYDEAYDMSHMLTSAERDNVKLSILKHLQEQMQQAIHSIESVEVELHAVWHKKLYKGIISVAESIDADLIVKSCKSHDKIGHKLFTPNDWHLLRTSQINVLMVKSNTWPENGKIVSALSVDANDDTHQKLNLEIANASHALADLLSAETHFVNTFVGAPVHIAVEVPSFSAEEYNNDVKEKHTGMIRETAIEFDMADDQLHVSEGLPEDVIPALCNELNAELLVVGSVGRQGISATLLGNTAEHIIDRIDCDTLVIKSTH